jgi:hypothetical protein
VSTNTTGGLIMGIWPDRLFFTATNAVWGASIGVAAALVALRADAWTGGAPSQALLLDGAVALFGLGFVIASLVRRRAPTVRGAFVVIGSAVGVYVAWTLAVAAPGWALLWVAAAVAGLIGLVHPLRDPEVS